MSEFARATMIAQSLISDDYNERVRCFNSLTQELLDDLWPVLSVLLSDDFVKTRSATNYEQITHRGVEARERMFEQMTNECDPRLSELRAKVFLL